MNPDRNVQTVLASVGEVTPTTSPVKRLLLVPTYRRRNWSYLTKEQLAYCMYMYSENVCMC